MSDAVRELTVELGERSYPILIGQGLWEVVIYQDMFKVLRS